jgi:hypothetical protein
MLAGLTSQELCTPFLTFLVIYLEADFIINMFHLILGCSKDLKLYVLIRNEDLGLPY